MNRTIMVMLVLGIIAWNGCQSTSTHKLLPAPSPTSKAGQLIGEGIQFYEQNEWMKAKQQFEAAITVSPDMAEAHYNLGMALYKLKDFKEGDRHFTEAANLAPGHKVIWNAPPLRGVSVPDKNPGLTDDGHGHAH